jgi:hypothetical protein
MTKQLEVSELLARAPLFASLNRNWCEILASSAQIHRLLKNQFLYRRGDAATGVWSRRFIW